MRRWLLFGALLGLLLAPVARAEEVSDQDAQDAASDAPTAQAAPGDCIPQGPAPGEPGAEKAASSLTAEKNAPVQKKCPEEGTGGAGASAQEAAQEQKKKKKLDAIGVPLVSYNSDLGFGFGLVGGGYYYSPGYTPYRHAVAAQIFFTTRGIQNHWIRYDGPNLIGKMRVELRGEYRRELFFPYYGAGNNSSPGVVGGGTDKATSFDYFFPGGWFRVRAKPLERHKQFELFAGYGYHWARIKQYAGSVLQQESPNGVQGGSYGLLSFGAFWDSRNSEADPSSGGVDELAVRFSSAATGSRYNYVGLTATDRHYFALGTPKLILAQRVIVDAIWGSAPFFEWSQFGGIAGGEGIGGMSSVRGVPRDRYQGNVKVVSNSELRWYPISFRVFGERTRAGGLLFFDMGRVWQQDVTDGPWWLWHPGVGAGLRIVRREAVARLDVGFATETWRPGIYVTFGHMF